LLTAIDPYSGQTNAASARAGAGYVLLLYTAFTFRLHTLKRTFGDRDIPKPASLYTWAVLVLPPVAIVVALGLASTY